MVFGYTAVYISSAVCSDQLTPDQQYWPWTPTLGGTWHGAPPGSGQLTNLDLEKHQQLLDATGGGDAGDFGGGGFPNREGEG
jgi:hypothetical protein